MVLKGTRGKTSQFWGSTFKPHQYNPCNRTPIGFNHIEILQIAWPKLTCPKFTQRLTLWCHGPLHGFALRFQFVTAQHKPFALSESLTPLLPLKSHPRTIFEPLALGHFPCLPQRKTLPSWLEGAWIPRVPLEESPRRPSPVRAPRPSWGDGAGKLGGGKGVNIPDVTWLVEGVVYWLETTNW